MEQIMYLYCVMVCFVLSCQAINPSELHDGKFNNAFKRKIMAAIEKNRGSARAASSTSVSANSSPPVPSVLQTNLPSPSKQKTSIPITSSVAAKKPRSITDSTEKKSVILTTLPPSSSGENIANPKPLDTQDVNVNININSNINNPEPTTTTVRPRTTTPKRIDCEALCQVIAIPTCGCAPNDSWA